MSDGDLADTVHAAIASIEAVSSRIEGTFAEVGNHLGRGQAIFGGLHEALTALSRELSGTKIEGAAAALQEISRRLNRLAEALPAEGALLAGIGKGGAGTSALLKSLSKHVKLITIIARSARIEAASLDQHRDSFLDFTQEAYELGKAVECSIEACVRDEELLSRAVETALKRQREFEANYKAKLLSAGVDLQSAYSGLRDHCSRSVHLTDLTSQSTRKMAEAVGRSIVSLQAGDSTRQRLEHVCRGLRVAAGCDTSLAPIAGGVAQPSVLACELQAAQLKDSMREFDCDIGQIVRALAAIVADADAIVGRGRSLYGGEDGDMRSSFLARIKDTLAQASELIGTCERAGKAVDEALAIVDDTLGKFRRAIAGLSEAVIDIILIGMNASLKAGQLGIKGSAFVVIANELKTTADQLSGGAAHLRPILDGIENSANELKQLRVEGDPVQLSNLEPSILHTIGELEAGGEQLAGLMSRLVQEGAEFNGLMSNAQSVMDTLMRASATLSPLVARLEVASPAAVASLAAADQAPLLDGLFAQYTMERERQVHAECLQRFGFAARPVAPRAEEDQADDGVLLF